MKTLLASFARNTVFANIVLVMIFLAGGLATWQTVRESFPEFSVDVITISVVYPGADPEEVEEGISTKIEDAIESVEGIKQYTTRSSEGVASVSIEVKDGYETNRVMDEVKSQVNAISTFPVDAENPIITEIIHKDVVMLLALTGDVPEKQMKEWGEQIRDEVKLIPDVSQVDVFGTRSYEIGVELSEERLKEFDLSLSTVARAIRQSSLNLAGGTLRTEGEDIRIRTIGRKYTGQELAKIVVKARSDGALIRLGQIATIKDEFTEDPVAARINSRPAMFVQVSKTSMEDSLKISDLVATYVQDKQPTLPPGVSIDVFYDNTEYLRARINLLTKNGLIGLCLVYLLLWLFLDLRLSFWAGMGIPISISGAMFLLWSMGATINMISLFGLIMVLGIVVDDAIVVGEAIYVQRKQGAKPLEAAIAGVNEVSMPVIAAVTTTIVAFLPLGFIGGTMGKFIKILPTVVISCLVVSLIECLILLPAHLNNLPDINKKPRWGGIFGLLTRFRVAVGDGLERFIEQRYVPFLKIVLNWRYVSLSTAIGILILSLGLVVGGFVKFQVFPKLDGFVITSTVEFPAGTPAKITQQALYDMGEAFERIGERTETKSGEPLIKQKLELLGQSLASSGRGKSGPHLGSVQILLLDSEFRGVHSNNLLIEWEKEVGQIPGAVALTFEGMQAGPSGAEIEVWLQGRNMAELVGASDDLQQELAGFQGVYQIKSDYTVGKNELQLSLKPEARTLGLTIEDLASQVNAGYFGREAFRMQRGKDDIRVKVRLASDERRRISDFETMNIRTPAGHEIPLKSLAHITFAPGYSTITRTDGLRRIVVTAEVDPEQANAAEIFADLSEQTFPALTERYDGLYLSMQGSKKDVRESLGSLIVGFPIAIVGIFIIVATIFKSYIQPFIILFTIPFGIIGAIIGHLIFGYDLSMMSVFGMVALSGVVINSSIVLIERVNTNLAGGMSLFEAVIQGGARRFRAIFLTTISTIGGLAPLIVETDMQAKFLIPMALSVAAGVAFATLLTLILIPSLLVIINDLRRGWHRILYGVWPTRTAVEPRANHGEVEK
ncbi:MAG: efflux RND transporter permease subunit [Desulfobulbaceae bacterium]|nr:MAG: efflux RND transporter permease subunit [Desulfobulbaceae bacterium]